MNADGQIQPRMHVCAPLLGPRAIFLLDGLIKAHVSRAASVLRSVRVTCDSRTCTGQQPNHHCRLTSGRTRALHTRSRLEDRTFFLVLMRC
jgi:hypothetical protein